MNFFEQELRRVAGACKGIINPTFAGRACYGDLGGDNRVKLQFVTQGTHERYTALEATVLNRLDGKVDTLLFRFGDVWGNKTHRGLHDEPPRIWTDQGKSEWYSYYPTDADMKKLATELGGYLDVFIDRSVIPEKTSVIKTIRDSKQTPTPRKETRARKKPGQEL